MRGSSCGRDVSICCCPNPETLTRYEVEIQLGPTDESHIIRTIEYWDIEKRRYPQYEHVAVIVAEDVTSRFLNVISLFNGSIPLVAIQIQGIEVNGAFTLVATRIIDVITLGTEEDEEGEATDRAYWEQKASRDTVQLVDEFARMIQVIEPELQPKYNKHYIGLANRGVARNFVLFAPRKAARHRGVQDPAVGRADRPARRVGDRDASVRHAVEPLPDACDRERPGGAPRRAGGAHPHRPGLLRPLESSPPPQWVNRPGNVGGSNL